MGTGAAIASTQWTGWVPDDGSCGGSDSNGAQFAVTNVVVHAPQGIKFGPPPPSPSPSPSPTPPTPGMCETSVGKNNDGTNMQSSATNTGSADECCSQCSSTDGCGGYTWVHATSECWLKSSVGPARDDDDVTTGTYSAPAPAPTPVPTPVPAPTPSPSPSPSGGCTGGDDGADLESCVHSCPSDGFSDCITCCAGKFPSATSV